MEWKLLNGSGSVNYYWYLNGVMVGTGASYTHTFYNCPIGGKVGDSFFDLKLKVTNSVGQTAEDINGVAVNSGICF